MHTKIYARITKIDEAKREVWGRAADETPDNAKEVYDYDTSKPFVKSWSEDFQKTTDGKSLGNVRAMHANIAAGKVIALTMDDVTKTIDIGAKIVDDNEWQKCLDGVYTGFSIGGKYVRKWQDPVNKTLTRYTANPGEISLADKPCNPSSKFYEVVKTDGAVVRAEFQTQEAAVEVLAKMFDAGKITPKSVLALVQKAETEDGDYIDPADITDEDRPDSVPVDEWDEMSDEEKAQAVADDMDGKTDGAGKDGVAKADACPEGIEQDKWDKMTPEEKAEAKKPAEKNTKTPEEQNAAVEAQARALSKAENGGDESKWQAYVGPAIRELAKAEFDPAPAPLVKNTNARMFDTGAAMALQALTFIALADLGKTVPAALAKWVDDGLVLIKAFDDKALADLNTAGTAALTELSNRVQIAKAFDDPKMTAEAFDKIVLDVLGEDGFGKVAINGKGIREALKCAVLEKVGARNSASDAANLQKAHDAIAACGAVCATPLTESNATATAVATKTDGGGDLAKTVATLQAELAELKKNTPMPRKGRFSAVRKQDDTNDGNEPPAKKTDDPGKVVAPGTHNPEAALDMIKAAVIETSGLRKL